MDSKLPREIGKANKDAADMVVTSATRRAQGMGGVQAHAAKRGMRAKRSQRAAAITLDGVREPTILGAEFGAKKYRQFPPWRGNQWNPDSGGVGYFLHPVIRDDREQIIGKYADVIDALLERTFR